MAGKKQTGRPSKYTEAIAEEICDRLAAGEGLVRICRDAHMPREQTVRLWVINDREGFYNKYAKAREIQAERMADEIVDISDDGKNDFMEKEDPDNPGYALNGEALGRSRLRVDTRKWYLSKVLPKKFGERQSIEHTGPNGGPIKTEHSIDLSSMSKASREHLRAILEAEASGE